ncbi:MAG: DUF6465 family protein [Lachnospiraceae bacterium]|nr:DUF6465 family protein [Lachnospiraceae bacterium]MDD6504903.1 DUF6465 family protein [Lachnospiraceae bacterium]
MARKDSAQRAEQLVGGFASAKKNITIQYQGRERMESNILTLIQRDAREKGVADNEIELVDVYIKPEEQSIYYVINNTINGQIPF